jgi:crotonobetainyl-CoA:carnitine CoA-transferase CaiB-like acyl-CoA transferase
LLGNNRPTNAPMGVFKTQDGYITIAASRPMWRKLCGALGAPELLERPEYATAASRVTHREALNANIEQVTQQHTSAAWIEILNHAGVPCGPIYTLYVPALYPWAVQRPSPCWWKPLAD